MNRGLEAPETTPVRVLAVGSSSALRAATEALEDSELAVRGPLESSTEREALQLEATDCLLTDERAVLHDLDDDCPVLFVVTSSTDETDDLIEEVQAAGATDIVDESAIKQPSLLAHRLRQTARLSDLRRTANRQESTYQALLEQSSDLVVVADEDGTVTFTGPTVEQVGGYEAETLCGSQITDTVHPNDVAAVSEAFDSLCEQATGASTTVEYRCQHANDSWYVHRAELTNRLADEIGGVVISIRDITEHHQVERELDEAFERVTDAFYALDSEWTFTYLNEQAASLLEVDPSTALGRPILELFPELRETPFHEAAREAMDTQQPVSLENYFQPTDSWYNVQIYPSPSGISVYFQDVTEQVEREQALQERTERLETIVQNVPVVFFVLDDDGTITLAEGRPLEDVDGVSGSIVGESVFDVFRSHPGILDDVREALEGRSTHSSVTVDGRVFEQWCRPITDEGSVERVIGVAVDVTERDQYQAALSALHEATSHLLTVESEQAACEYVVDIAADVLGLESAVYRFDDQRNELVPAAYSSGFESTGGPPPRLQPNGSITWETFISGTASRFDDIRESEAVYDPEIPARSGLFVPIGEHGVLVALHSETGQYDDDTYELAKLFATTAEAALDRITRTQRLHGHEWELKEQNRHLERLNDASQVRQEIEQLLLMSDSRAEIEQGICDRLAALEDCSFAWIGEPDPSGNQLQRQVQAGHARGYLDAVSVTTVDDSAAEPTGRAARTRTPVHVDNVADAIRDGTWRGEALTRNFQSVYSVPLVYDDFLYGVLALYGDERDAFDGPLRSTLAELGETIGYAMDAVKRKTGLRDEDVAVVELELELEGDLPLSRLADRLETSLEYEGATIRDDGSPTVFVATADPVSVAEASAIADLEGIAALSVIAETETETLLQLQYTEPFLSSVVDAHGGALRAFVTDTTETRAVVNVPETIEIRDVLSGLNRRGFVATMVARREQPSSQLSTIDAATRNALLERLTDRQQEVVQTAYHGGFFEWPRQTTGEGIADSIGISSPAFHKHVRAAEQKLFAALFDGPSK